MAQVATEHSSSSQEKEQSLGRTVRLGLVQDFKQRLSDVEAVVVTKVEKVPVVRISQLRDGLQVGVAQEILFPSGSARLSRQGVEVLKTVAARFADSTYSISVEGHSDNLPITGTLQKRYPSNWELAGARAASVVRLFAEGGVDGVRLTAVSRGSTRPVADNSSPEGRARNRRIEIRLRPMGEADVVDVPEAGPGKGS